jgi:hypothetical protein
MSREIQEALGVNAEQAKHLAKVFLGKTLKCPGGHRFKIRVRDMRMAPPLNGEPDFSVLCPKNDSQCFGFNWKL